METIGTFPIELSGEPYQIEIGSWKARDITDFSPKTTVPGTGAVFGTLQMYQPIMASNWQHGFGFVWHDDEAGYLRTDGNIDTRHRGAAMMFTNNTSSDTNNNIKNGGLTFGSSFLTWGASGVRAFTSSSWSQINIERPVYDATSEGSGTGIADLGTLTFSHTVTTEGASRVLIVMVMVDAAATDFVDVATMDDRITATYNSVAMTFIPATAVINTVGIIAFQLVNPATGANDIVISFNTEGGTTEAVAIGASFLYVEQTTPIGTAVSNTGTAVSCTDASDGSGSDDQDLVVDMVGILQSESAASAAIATGQTQIAQDDITTGTDILLVSSYEQAIDSDPTPDLAWTWTNSVVFAQCLIPLKPIAELEVNSLFEDGEFVFANINEQRLMKSAANNALVDYTPAGFNNRSNDYSWMEIHGGFIFAGKENEAEVYFDTNSDLSALSGDPVDDADELVAGPGTVGTKAGISFLEKLAVARNDGLWTMDTDDSDSSKWISKRTLNFRNLSDDANFRSMATWGGSLYFSIQDKILYQWNGAKLQDITPKRITVDWEYINYFRFDNLTPFGPWLLMSMRTSGTLSGDTGYRESIVAWDGVGFHALAHPITDGDGSVTMIAIDTINNYIWYHVNKPSANTNVTSYLPFQSDTDLPFAAFPTASTPANQLTTSRIHAGFRRVDKSMPALWVECDNLSTTQTIEVQYAIDDGSTFHTWDTLTQSGETVLILPQNKYTQEFKYIRLRFIFVTGTSAQTPVLEAYAMMVMMRPDFKMGYSFNILGGTNAASGMFEDDRSGYSIMHDLRRLRDSKSPIELITPFGDKVYGYLTSLTEIALEYEPEDDQGGSINILQLIRCNFVETIAISGTEQDVEPSW